MPRIALIQDGTEVGRQWFGDVVAHVQRCCARLDDGQYTKFSLNLFADDEVGSLLDGLNHDNWSCLVFASNSLNSGRIEQELSRRRDTVRAYIAAGGGIVVLHHVRPSLSVLLPSDLEPALHERTVPRGEAAVTTEAPGDVLLNFPQTVALPSLRDLDDDDLQMLQATGEPVDLPSLYFMAMGPGMPAKLKPVLTVGTDVVLARTHDYLRERVVIGTFPLDWQEHRADHGAVLSKLLSNAIHFASVGTPGRLVWRESGRTRNELLLRWLSLDGATVIHPAPSEPMDEVDRWLLSAVDVLAMAPERLDAINDEVVAEFLRGGGVLLTSSPDPTLPASRVVSLVGAYQQRNLAANLTAELRAVEGWRSIDSAFDIRNIVCAVAFTFTEGVRRAEEAPLAPGDLSELTSQISARLLADQHREDLASSIALAQTLAQLIEPEAVGDELVEWTEKAAVGRPFPVEMHVRALRSVCRRQVDPTLLSELVGELEANVANMASPAPVVRVLEIIAMLAQADLLKLSPHDAERLGDAVCAVLEKFNQTPDRGWVSVEATGSITLGLVALYEKSGRGSSARSRMASTVALAVTALNRAQSQYERTAKGVAWLSRLVHALIVADRSFPLGLQRFASLPWPDQPGATENARLQRELTQHLAVQNESLRSTQRQLEEQLQTAKRTLSEQRLAASIGRATTTAVPTIILLIAAWAVAAAIGWTTINGLLANVTVLLSIVLTLLTIVFGLLEGSHLLAAPARGIREWMAKHGVEALTSLGKLKRQ